MKRTWAIIGVKDVAASSKFYLSLFGQEPRPSHHDDFDMILDEDDTVLVCLHQWGGHGEGPPLEDPGKEAPGNGLLLLFRVDDFDGCLQRARSLVPKLEQEPAIMTAGTGTMAFTIRDPDGYYLTFSAA